jgi:cobalt/nickel transport system permease protein
MRNAIVTFAIVALLTGGALSIFASTNPAGLEWALEKIATAVEFEKKEPIKTAFMPDYNFKNEEEDLGISVAGVVGSALTFLLAAISAFAISVAKRKAA